MKQAQWYADHPPVNARLAELKAAARIPYWVVLSYQDGLDLLAGKVPDALRTQILTLCKRGRSESAEEYAARIEEASA